MDLRWCIFIGGPLVCCLCPAWAGGIYASNGQDGSLHLSNVPTDDHYQLLIAAPPSLNTDAGTIPDAPSALSRHKLPYDQIIQKAAQTNGLDSALLHAVIAVESKHNPKALSHKGAVGMMQLMPGTARRYGAVDLYDPGQNIQAGAKYLRDLLTLFDGNVQLALAAYNAGEATVARYGNRIPPYRETAEYVPRVLDAYHKYQGRTAD